MKRIFFTDTNIGAVLVWKEGNSTVKYQFIATIPATIMFWQFVDILQFLKCNFSSCNQSFIMVKLNSKMHPFILINIPITC